MHNKVPLFREAPSFRQCEWYVCSLRLLWGVIVWHGGCSRQYIIIMLRLPLQDDIFKEIDILIGLDHPNVIFLKEYFEENNKVGTPPSIRHVLRLALAADSAISALCVPSSIQASLQARQLSSAAHFCV